MGVAGGAAALMNTGNTGGATSARRSSQPCPGVAKHPDGSSGHGLATAEGCRNFLQSAVEDFFPSVSAEKYLLLSTTWTISELMASNLHYRADRLAKSGPAA